jgi:trigger factor
MQQNESPRRVRARLEKRGQMDTLRNQIIESKVINLVAEQAKFEDVPMAAKRGGYVPGSAQYLW